MVDIKEICTKEDLLIMGSLKIELMQYHLQYALQFGIDDIELIQYDLEQALSTAESRNNFLFIRDNTPVGMAQVEEQISDVDGMPILFVHGIYIKPSARNSSIAGIFLRYLCRRYKKRIECECWYDLPASILYQKAGFKPMVTRYVLPLSNRFYGSDQN